MTTLSNWSSEVPSGTSLIRKGDDQIRSEKEVEYNAWEEGHYWDSGSADSGGKHDATIGAGPLVSVGTPSTFSVRADTARLFYDSERTVLAYVGNEGAVEVGVPSPYQPFFLSENTSPEQLPSTNPGRLPAGKVWVLSVQSIPPPDDQVESNLTHYSWFTKDAAGLGPYDGVPMFMCSAVSLSGLAVWSEIRVLSWDSSGFTVGAESYDNPGQVGVPTGFSNDETSDLSGFVMVLSIGSMDASRIS